MLGTLNEYRRIEYRWVEKYHGGLPEGAMLAFINSTHEETEYVRKDLATSSFRLKQCTWEHWAIFMQEDHYNVMTKLEFEVCLVLNYIIVLYYLTMGHPHRALLSIFFREEMILFCLK